MGEDHESVGDAAASGTSSLARSAPDEPDSLLRAVAAAPRRRPVGPRLAKGTIVDGTFRIESELGAGAMGVVYMATDLALDRRVALKLHASIEDDVRRSRMWREAKAMARLSDPNVITVHEVGVFDSRVYIAMELVDGGPASAWLSTPRTWREVLEAFTQAARGLAAAHRVGLVHRDFKASNMLIGTDGRVRVADFGLARAVGDVAESSASSSGSDSFDERLTATGVTMGTPAYMAPEQLGGEVDHRSDQFSFCVALHEALWGIRPYDGRSAQEMRDAAKAGRFRPVPEDRAVPTWLRAVVLRGLRPRPEDRYSDMDALVAALQSDPTRRRRARAVVATTAGVMIGLVGLVAYLGVSRAPLRDCTDRGALLGAAWDDAARERVRTAVVATGVSYAAQTLVRLEASLDAYADAWLEVAERACQPDGAPLSAGLQDARALCLEHRKRSLSALVEVLAAADARTVERAVSAVANLPAAQSCGDVAYLGSKVAPPPDPQVAAGVEATRASLDTAFALELAGRFTDGFAIAQDALVEARTLGYGPLVGEALTRVGFLEDTLGRYDRAEANLREGYAEAIASGDDEVAATAATRLAYVVGHQLARHDDGLEWGFLAMAVVRRLGLGDRREATLLNNLGAIHQQRGEYEESLGHHRRALGILEESLGPEHIEVARVLHNLGIVYRLQGNFPTSIEHHRRALALREAALGPEHPAVASALLALGAAHFESGDRDTALVETRRTLELRERALGPDHPDVAAVLANLGNILERRGEYDEALASLERSLAIDRRVVGLDHPGPASTIESIGNVRLARGETEAALERYRASLEIRERVLGREHPHVGFSLANIALALEQLGRHGEAVIEARRALAIGEASLGPEHPSIAGTLDNIGNMLAADGRHDEAMVEHRRALAIREKALGPEDPAIALSLINIANDFEARGDFDAALEHNRRALAVAEAALGPDHPDVALALFNVGQTRVHRREFSEAIPDLERSLRLSETVATPANVLTDRRFELAMALAGAGTDPARARALARQARDGYTPDAGTLALREAIDAWLVTQQPPRR
jgi:tetratricopeptide (TPR) repeat protein